MCLRDRIQTLLVLKRTYILGVISFGTYAALCDQVTGVLCGQEKINELERELEKNDYNEKRE